MIKSVGWNWKEEKSNIWKNPCEESYYYCQKWLGEGRKTVLDLGCGLGRHSILFAANGLDVTAVDISEDAVASVKDWQAECGLEFPALQMDMQHLDFADNTFDCIWSYMVVSHTDTQGFAHLLGEIERVLKPGGQIFITLCSKDDSIFKRGGARIIDENTIIKSNEGSEKDVPHFYMNMDDIQKSFDNFTLNRVRHIDNCCYDGKLNENKHYFVEATLKN